MPVVRASEIGEYLYCRRAWWLHRVQGMTSANVARLEAGVAAHAIHGRRRGLAGIVQVLALILTLLAVIVLFWR